MKNFLGEKSCQTVLWSMVLSLVLVLFPCLVLAGQPEDPAQCVEGNEPLYLDYGQHTVGCQIDNVTDLDQIRVTVSPGDIGTLLRLNATRTGGFLGQRIEVWDPCETKVIDEVNNNFTADLPIDCAGEFRIFISDDNNAHTGTYTVHIERIPPVYAPKVSYGCGYDDSVDHVADVDFLVFDGVAGTKVQLIATRTGGSLGQRIEVWDPSDVKIENEVNNNYSKEFDLSLTGEYLVAISDDNRAHTGTYIFNIECLFGSCPPDPAEGPPESPSCTDGIDNDCDGFIDDEDEDCLGPPLFSMDIKVNGSDRAINVTPDDTVSVTVELEDGPYEGLDVDLWIGAATPSGAYWYNSAGNWIPSLTPIWYYQKLSDIPKTTILNIKLPWVGVYEFFIVGDTTPDGLFGIAVRDQVAVFVGDQ
jgi:hypothetical protein